MSRLLSDFKGGPMRKQSPAPKKSSTESAESRKSKLALLRRAKNSERKASRWAQEHDGPDPRYANLTTSTGRIGHITGLQADYLSQHYCSEHKNSRLPAGLAKFWRQIVEISVGFQKDPLLSWEPSNAKDYPANGKPLPILHVITQDRHAELLDKERFADENGYKK